MEILGFIGAIIGLIAAIINRKQIVVHTTSTESYSNPIGKRFKRAILAFGIGIVFIIIAALADPNGKGSVTTVMAILMLIGFAIAAYQILAMFIAIFLKLWR